MRKRFTREEAEAFQPGTRIEWRNGRHWYPGEIARAVTRDADGWDSLGLVNHGPATRTVSPGAYLTGIPTYVRLPVTSSTADAVEASVAQPR